MKVSIVIPIYNGEEFLRKCLNSVIKQKYSNLEIILINDGSTDNSGDICEEYARADKRIKVIHKDNGGQSEARNFGIEKATGDYLSFIDCDDEVTENCIDILIKTLISYEADIAIGSYTYVTEKKIINNETGEVSLLDTETAIKRMLLNDGFDMGPWAKLYKRSLFDTIRFPVGKFFEDSLTSYQIFAKADKVIFNSVSIYKYYLREKSTVNGEFSLKKLDLIEMNEKNYSFIKDKFPNLEKEARRRLFWAYCSTLNQIMSSNDKEVIDKYSPKITTFILDQENFIRENKWLPIRDKLGYYSLKFFGKNGYFFIWKLYLRLYK